jgi:hypothetical protein
MSDDYQVSGQDLNTHLFYGGQDSSKFIHENIGPNHDVIQSTFTSPSVEFTYQNTFNPNHIETSYTNIVQVGSDTLEYKGHSSLNGSNVNVIEQSYVNGVKGELFHYNSNSNP